MAERKLHKSNKNRMICGVCSGFAEYFKIDPTIVRLIFIIVGLLRGIGLIFYILCAVLMPNDADYTYDASDVDVKDDSSLKDAKVSTPDVPHTDEEFDSFFKDNK